MVVICKYCNKEYASYASRSNHSKKFHSNDSNPEDIQNNKLGHSEVIPKSSENPVKIFACIKCNAHFKYKQGKWKHEKKCNVNILKHQNVETKLKEENNELKEQLKLKDKHIEEFKIQILDLIKKSCKIHPKTLQKINNTLNNNSNNTVNNTYIVQFGREKLYEVFSKKEQIDVLNCGNLCLENLIEKAHFNAKYPQFKNILITNLQNNLAYKYNAETNNFDVLTKKELLEDIISERMYDIEEFFNNYRDDITPKMQMVIENFIKKMDTESYEEIKKQNIKIILYNNRSFVDKANIIV